MRRGTRQERRWNVTSIFILCVVAFVSCGDGDDDAVIENGSGSDCDSEPGIRTTAEGVQFVRTPDSCFRDLPDFPYEARYVEIDGLRQGYVDEGPADADPVLLLHGQPSWSYLYRKMIPVLVAGGYRVIAMDHLGMGRSDKPIDIEYYSYLGHIDRLEKFIGALNLEHITMFCQDWGSLIGLHVAGEHPEWFARIVVGDGTLPVVPRFIRPYPPVRNPNEINTEIVSPFANIPPQQPPFYDEDCNLLIRRNRRLGFTIWMRYSMTGASFHPAEVLEALTYYDLPSDEEDAYDAPFPSRIYMAGPRVFPSLVNELPGVNDDAWAGLTRYEKPFLTIWATNDPGNLGRCETQDRLINNVPGAEGQPHTRLPEASHFLQDDQGAEIARQMVEFMTTDCIDNDGDGYGYPATHDCEHPEVDCDGENPDVNPGMTEIPGNGVDDDCDPGTRGYSGPANTIAASYGKSSLTGSGLFNSLALLLIPVGWVMLLRKLSRKL